MHSDLKHSGLSTTRVRIALLEMLRGAQTPLSVEDLGKRLVDEGIDAGRASLFRNLDAFVQAGLAERVASSKRGSAYIACARGHDDHHHHIICQQCHHTEAVDVCLSGSELKAIETETHYRVTGHSLTLYGLCSECRK